MSDFTLSSQALLEKGAISLFKNKNLGKEKWGGNSQMVQVSDTQDE